MILLRPGEGTVTTRLSLPPDKINNGGESVTQAFRQPQGGYRYSAATQPEGVATLYEFSFIQ